MVKHAVSKSILGAVTSIALYAACSGETIGRSPGGETNWLGGCRSDAACHGDARSLCGACTKACGPGTSCTEVPGSACARSGSAAFEAACDAPSVTGACLVTCPVDGCAGTTTCVGGFCVPPPVGGGGLLPPPLRGASGGSGGQGSAVSTSDSAAVGADGGSCRMRALPAGVLPNCTLVRCDDGGCRSCDGSTTPSLTGSAPAPCTDNPCNPSCQRFADGATPLTRWPAAEGGAPASVTRDYQYSATCPSGTQPQWSFLTYGADTPGASRIVLSVPSQVSCDSGGAGLCPPSSVTLATIGEGPGGAPDECTLLGAGGTCPIQLFDRLRDVARLGELTFMVELIPSGSDHPTLKWWELRYSCVDGRYVGTCDYGGRTWANVGRAIIV